MKLIYLVVFIIIIIIGIYLYLFIQDRKNKGKENNLLFSKRITQMQTSVLPPMLK